MSHVRRVPLIAIVMAIHTARMHRLVISDACVASCKLSGECRQHALQWPMAAEAHAHGTRIHNHAVHAVLAGDAAKAFHTARVRGTLHQVVSLAWAAHCLSDGYGN
jgi:hypothetical protein